MGELDWMKHIKISESYQVLCADECIAKYNYNILSKLSLFVLADFMAT